MKNNNQKCSHSDFYTMHSGVYCNYCHKYLGYYDYYNLRGFVKKTRDTIDDEDLNTDTVKVSSD